MARCTFGTLVVFLASAFTLASSSASAQSAPAPVRLSIQIVNVKPEALNEWIALQEKETIPGPQEDQGGAARGLDDVVFWRGLPVFLLTAAREVRQLRQSAGPDDSCAWRGSAARIYNDKLRKMIVSQQTLAITVLPGEHRPAGILRAEVHDPELQLRGSGPARPTMRRILRNDLIPIIRKAKPAGYSLPAARFTAAMPTSSSRRGISRRWPTSTGRICSSRRSALKRRTSSARRRAGMIAAHGAPRLSLRSELELQVTCGGAVERPLVRLHCRSL